MDAARLRDIRARIRSGHGLTLAEADELDAEIERLNSSPEARLVQLVGDIGARTATSLERADQAHERASDAHARVDAALARLEPVLIRLATAEAARQEAATQQVARDIARQDRVTDRLLDTLALAAKSRWAQAALTTGIGWLLSRMATWTAAQ